MKTHYEILEVLVTASPEQIKKAYWRLARKHHPDIAPDGTEIFKRINNAYTTLTDPNARKKYDHTLKMGSVNSSSKPSPQDYRTHTSRYFERLTLINATKSIWAVNINYDELLQRKVILIENPAKPSKKIELQLDSTIQQGYKWILKNQGIIGEDVTLVANILNSASRSSSYHHSTPEQPSNGQTKKESENNGSHEPSKESCTVSSLTIETLARQSIFDFLYKNKKQLVSFSSDFIKTKNSLSLEDELVWHILLGEISKLTISTKSNDNVNPEKRQAKHPLGYSIDELKEVIIATLHTSPNRTCTKKSLCTKVLANLGLVTRGKPRTIFEENIMEAVKQLIIDGNVEEYKAKNIRLRLISWK